MNTVYKAQLPGCGRGVAQEFGIVKSEVDFNSSTDVRISQLPKPRFLPPCAHGQTASQRLERLKTYIGIVETSFYLLSKTPGALRQLQRYQDETAWLESFKPGRAVRI